MVLEVVHDVALGTHTLKFLFNQAFDLILDILSFADGRFSDVALRNCFGEALIFGYVSSLALDCYSVHCRFHLCRSPRRANRAISR